MTADTIFLGVRLLDASSGVDTLGDLLVRDGIIADFGSGLGRPDGAVVVQEDGAVLCPGLVDMRAALGEPGYEYRETIASAAAAAAAGGITTLAALPDTLPAIDDPALVHMMRRRGEETGSLTILPYAAVTTGCRGEALAELGLLREAGAVAFTDGANTLRSARLMRLALSYARGFGARIVQHPEEQSLAAGGAATEGELATRLGLPGIPGRRRGDPGRARHPAGAAYRRGGAFRACLHRRRAGADPPCEGGRRGGHLRHRPAIFRLERDRDRRLPHLCQAVAAAAQGCRSPGGGGGAGGRHDRRGGLGPPAARRRRQAPAVRPGDAGRCRAGHVARGDAGAGA